MKIQLYHICTVILCDCVDESRATFLGNGGCERLAAVLKSYSTLPVSADNEKLKCVICGCLSNTCSEQNGKTIIIPTVNA